MPIVIRPPKTTFSRHSLSSASSSEAPLLPSSGASRPEFTYHILSQDRRWQVLLQDIIRRLIHTLSKRALGDIVRQAMKLCKLDLARKRSGLSISGASSVEGDSSATLFEGPTATGNAVERSVPSFFPSSPRRDTYTEPHDWLASEGGDRIGNAGSLREDAGGLVDNDHTGDIGEDAGAVCYVAGDALDFDDPRGFEVYAGGSVNDDPSSFNDYSGFLNDDDNTSTISLLNGEPLADANLCVSLQLSSSSTPYSHSSSWIKSWIAGVAESRRGAREDSSASHRQGAREDPPRFASKREAICVAKEPCPSSLVRGEKDSRVASKHVAWDVRKEEPSTSRGEDRAVPKAAAAQITALTR